ncbi:hypothetical protein [Cohnella sp. AR92]|uniref:hypothetical protein n=1 Tax=Cohnella sp. AR92 TaxID=648716 RepID=UPI000F8DED79|nr:hypothetical protein [Cohnella sp. AR92]RUS44980.1 hypothetical protein ELR57_22255 [Cohnella sp. AR92]
MKSKQRVAVVFLLLFVMTSIFLPLSSALASPVELGSTIELGSDPWYAKPFLWILDQILSVFGGIHDPADHVFYHSCFENETGCDDKVFGLYSEDNFNHVIRRGYALLSIAMGFIITAAVVKAGTLYSVTPLSSTMKIETTETLIKCMIGIVLITNFFTVSGTLFKANDMVVSMFYQDIKQPVDLSYYGENLNGDLQSSVAEGDRIKLRDFSSEQSSFGRLIVSFATRGLSIWWEVFYLQRYMFISLLLVLAPLWISMMFYPMLQGITIAAFKELWSQIIAQGIHAALFWLFFNLFGENIGWFHVTVAMALFIPISESVRFIFGSTSQTGSKLAMAGTVAGVGAFMHMGRAIGDVKNGISTVRDKQASGKSGSAEQGGARGGSKAGASVMAHVGGMMGGSGAAANGSADGAPSNSFASRMRLAGALTGGFSKGAGRFAGASMGVGLGPVGQFAFSEAGAAVGEAAGYRAGALSVAAGKGAHSWVRNTKEHFNDAQQKKGNPLDEPRYQNADPLTKAVVRSAPMVGSAVTSAFKGVAGGVEERNDPAIKRASAEKVYGAISEVIGGKGGYQLGEKFAQWRHTGKPLSSGSFTPDQQVYTVETRDGSFLATQENGQFTRISNIGRGNASLGKGQVVARTYTASKVNGQPFAIKPMMQPSEIRPGSMEEVPPVTYDSEGVQMVYQGRTVNPAEFLEKGRPANHVDLRRKNMSVPSLQSAPSALQRAKI